MRAAVALGGVLITVGASCSVLSGVLDGRAADRSPTAPRGGRWWRGVALLSAGNGLFVGGLIAWAQSFGLWEGIALGVAVLGVVIAAWAAVLWAVRRRRAVQG